MTNVSHNSEGESHHERELGGQLLASVSRSFYLTLKALPRGLREPISLAYLLARTADTVADTAEVPGDLRLECLDSFQNLIDSETEAGVHALQSLVGSRFAPLQTDPAERRLMERFAEGLAWLRTMRPQPLASIRGVLRPIIRGQALDIRRFPADGQLRSLRTAEELHDYTWLVAGCVGEFWTELCNLEKPGSIDTTLPLDQMKAWGADLGRGLQLINILRDLREDIAAGRCYLPEDEWRSHGLTPRQVAECAPELRTVWHTWLGICRNRLRAGLDYVRHVTDGRLRYATALPLLLGAKTVARLEAATWDEILRGVKITRLDVAAILAETALAAPKPERLEKLFQKLLIQD